MSEEKLNKVQEFQNELYRLFNVNVFNLEGITLQEDENPPGVFLSKEEVVEACLKVLNEFGEMLSKDENYNK